MRPWHRAACQPRTSPAPVRVSTDRSNSKLFRPGFLMGLCHFYVPTGTKGTVRTPMPTQGVRFGGVRLRWLLVLIVAIAAAPSFALNLARLSAASETALAAAHERAATLARDGAQAHVEILAKSRQLLEILRQVPAVRHVTTECNATLRSIHDNRPWITSIFVVDRAGRGICGSMEHPQTFDISKREYFQAALNRHSVSVSDVIIGQVSKRPIMVATLPMFDERKNLDIVVGFGIDLAWINRTATEASAKFGGIIVAVDRAGRV